MKSWHLEKRAQIPSCPLASVYEYFHRQKGFADKIKYMLPPISSVGQKYIHDPPNVGKQFIFSYPIVA